METSLITQQGAVPAYISSPKDSVSGGIVVIQEAFGLTDHIKQICDRLAHAQYLAVAPALFHRQGSPVFAYSDSDSAISVLQTLNHKDLDADIDAALTYLKNSHLSVEKSGVIGFCMGGTIAFHTGVRHTLGAAVSFYGGGISKGRFGYPPMLDAVPYLRTPWLGLYGDQDRGIPTTDVETLRNACRKSPVSTEMVRYPEAGHGFNCDARAAYHAPSAQDAWNRTIAWLERSLRTPEA